MPTMPEIYQSYSKEYDELVSYEDYQGNLRKFITNDIDIKDKKIIEMGAGTGRITKMLIPTAKSIQVYDGSGHMLEFAKKELAEYQSKLSFNVCNNIDIESIKEKADILIEGWSFGHTIIQRFDDFDNTLDKLVKGCLNILNPGGQIIIIETMGTNTEIAKAPSEGLSLFYLELEKSYGFEKRIIRTDYNFKTNQKAKELLGFFFGEELKNSIVFYGEGIVREHTGIWIKTKV